METIVLPRFCLVAAFCLAGLGIVSAQKPRIATVNASELFAKYYRTETEQAKLAAEQEKIANEARTAMIEQTRAELAELGTQSRSTSNSEDSRQEYFRKYQMKLHELRSLERDTIQYRQERQKEINRKLVTISKILLSEVQSTVQRVAMAQGYDMVLDVSGDTSSQMPTLIYIREATDITSQVLKELNRSKPAPLPPGVTALPPSRRPPPPAPVPAPVPAPLPATPDPPDPTPALRAVPATDE